MTPFDVRVALRANGYCPVPVFGKRPAFNNWQEMRNAGPEHFRGWDIQFPKATNSGGLTETTPTFDIDIRHPEAAEECAAAVSDWIGDSGPFLTRFGQAPKRAVLFQTNTPFSKIRRDFRHPNDQPGEKPHGLEFLCDGQQVVLDGVHEDTGKAYSWHGGSPLTVARTDLPGIDQDGARQLLDYCADILVQQYGFVEVTGEARSTNGNGASSDASSGPVDVGAEFAAMRDGKHVNEVMKRVVPSLLHAGHHPEEVLNRVVDEVMAVADARGLCTKDGKPWTREEEAKCATNRILSGYKNLLLKDYDPSTGVIPDWLPGEFHEIWIAKLQQGLKPVFGWNRGGFYIRKQQGAGKEENDAELNNSENENGPDTGTNDERKYRFRLVSFQDMRPGLEPVYLVDELIPSAGLVLVWGKQKTYKSFWLLDLMLHVAMGWPYRDRAVRQGAVVYCAFEGAHGYKGRIEAQRRHYGIADDVAVPLYIMPGQADLIHDEKTLIADFRAQLDGTVPSIVVLDTLNRSLKGSENSDEDMTKYTRAAEAIRAAFGCVVIIVHHCGYDETHSRGHTSLPAAVDAELSVTRGEGSPLFLVTVKNMRDGPEGTTVKCRAQTVPLDADQNGRPRTSIAIIPDDSPVDPSQKGRKDAAYPALMSALRLAIATHGSQFQPDGKMPVRAVAEKEVRAVFYRNYIDAEDETKKSADAQKSAFKRSLRKAIECGAVCGQKDNRGTAMLWFLSTEENYQ